MTYITSQLQSLLNRSNVKLPYPYLTIISVGQVHVRDRDGTVVKINRLIDGGAGNITVSRRVRWAVPVRHPGCLHFVKALIFDYRGIFDFRLSSRVSKCGLNMLIIAISSQIVFQL